MGEAACNYHGSLIGEIQGRGLWIKLCPYRIHINITAFGDTTWMIQLWVSEIIRVGPWSCVTDVLWRKDRWDFHAQRNMQRQRIGAGYQPWGHVSGETSRASTFSLFFSLQMSIDSIMKSGVFYFSPRKSIKGMTWSDFHCFLSCHLFPKSPLTWVIL